MTQSIDRKTREKSRAPHDGIEHVPDDRSSKMVIGIRCFTAASVLAGAVLTGFAIHAHPAQLVVTIAAATCFVMAVVGGSLLCVNAMLADRQRFYRRGQLNGWMRGWRGQEPEVDDPLMR